MLQSSIRVARVHQVARHEVGHPQVHIPRLQRRRLQCSQTRHVHSRSPCALTAIPRRWHTAVPYVLLQQWEVARMNKERRDPDSTEQRHQHVARSHCQHHCHNGRQNCQPARYGAHAHRAFRACLCREALVVRELHSDGGHAIAVDFGVPAGRLKRLLVNCQARTLFMQKGLQCNELWCALAACHI
jgi:hypothetical protein